MEFLKKVEQSKLWHHLKARPAIGGLEITDGGLRYVTARGDNWQMVSQKLPPEVVVNGEVVNKNLFLEALSVLRGRIQGELGLRHRLKVVVSVASGNIYLQPLPLPQVTVEEMEKAVELNLRMISPVNFKEVYTGWQNLGDQVEGKFEILSAFIKKETAFGLEQLLREAHFYPLILEPRSLAIARLLREAGSGFRKEDPAIIVLIDDEGIDFLVVRGGQLYFEYFQLWKNLYGEEKKLALEDFRAAVIRSTHQVMNFYNQRWPSETLNQVILLAHSLNDEVKSILTTSFSFEVRLLSLSLGENVETQWYGALGSALRGKNLRQMDKELSLLGRTPKEELHREQLIDFFNFWAFLTPMVLLVIFGVMILTDVFLIRERRRIESLPTRPGADQAELQTLQREAQVFNQRVAILKTIKGEIKAYHPLLELVGSLSQKHQLKTGRLFLQAENSFSLSGGAKDQDAIIRFKKELETSPNISSVELPLSLVRRDPGSGDYSFVINFSFAVANAS